MLRSSMLQMASSVNCKIIPVTDDVECECLRSSMLQMASSVNGKIIHVTDDVECEC